ncbi:unnamed protein product [Leuciscus chuanchicus]
MCNPTTKSVCSHTQIVLGKGIFPEIQMTNVPGLMSHGLAGSWCCRPSWPVGEVVLDDLHCFQTLISAHLTLQTFPKRLLSARRIGVRGKLQTSPRKMVNTALSDEEKGIQDKESKEESILAMLGIIGTILNLVVIIFVYIYTTL